jgi:hypothetical protein
MVQLWVLGHVIPIDHNFRYPYLERSRGISCSDWLDGHKFEIVCQRGPLNSALKLIFFFGALKVICQRGSLNSALKLGALKVICQRGPLKSPLRLIFFFGAEKVICWKGPHNSIEMNLFFGASKVICQRPSLNSPLRFKGEIRDSWNFHLVSHFEECFPHISVNQELDVVQISHHGDFFKTNCLDLKRLCILQSSKEANFILFRSKFDFSILRMHPKFRIFGFVFTICNVAQSCDQQ